ncbi:MAG: endonuclease domain-containing protein [Endomicrobia bacterium]|nr:endonuclease domain-containing protein [Endomicrobiia bacterium]MCL2506147.1 endonuclease domain-containing protein [Endomicrobiia bacterium]
MRRFVKNEKLKLTNLARSNRKQSTDAEKEIWNLLRNKQTGYSFRRQHQIGSYIVDFVCLAKKFIIEIDGGQHNDTKKQVYDEKRTKFFNNNGFKVLRFWNNEVLSNLDGVYVIILNALTPPSP